MELIKHYYSYLHFIHISLKERAFKYQARSFVIKIVDNIFIDTVAIKIKLANLSFEQLSNQPQGKKKQQNERFYEIFIAKKKKKERERKRNLNSRISAYRFSSNFSPKFRPRFRTSATHLEVIKRN